MDQLTDLISPEDEVIASINAWLGSNGVSKINTVANRDFIHIEVPVSKAEELFGVTYQVYHHDETDMELVKTLGPYKAPAEIAAKLDFVSGNMGFPRVHKAVYQSNMGAPEGTLAITPEILRQRYNVSSKYVGGLQSNRQAVAEFQGQYYSPADLKTFFHQYVSGSHNNTVTKVVGENDSQNPGVEASLDIQYIMGVALDVPTWFWSVPAYDFWADLVEWTSQIGNTTDAPWVQSVSYGDQAEGPAGDYKDRLNVEFQKMGARGISVIFASGDSGTGCYLCFYFEPSFPATSPYVTSVGATRFLQEEVGPEAAVEAFGSGGGMSWHFPMPEYQKTAVENFFATSTNLPESHYYNQAGRGTPDVAALGIGFEVIVNGETNSVGGTSASAPTFAGIVSLLNEYRLGQKKATLGFLNPFIYQNPGAFWDVTEGNNQHGCCVYTGFSCAAGWDPVTGLGTPNFEQLLSAVKRLA